MYLLYLITRLEGKDDAFYKSCIPNIHATERVSIMIRPVASRLRNRSINKTILDATKRGNTDMALGHMRLINE